MVFICNKLDDENCDFLAGISALMANMENNRHVYDLNTLQQINSKKKFNVIETEFFIDEISLAGGILYSLGDTNIYKKICNTYDNTAYLNDKIPINLGTLIRSDNFACIKSNFNQHKFYRDYKKHSKQYNMKPFCTMNSHNKFPWRVSVRSPPEDFVELYGSIIVDPYNLIEPEYLEKKIANNIYYMSNWYDDDMIKTKVDNYTTCSYQNKISFILTHQNINSIEREYGTDFYIYGLRNDLVENTHQKPQFMDFCTYCRIPLHNTVYYTTQHMMPACCLDHVKGPQIYSCKIPAPYSETAEKIAKYLKIKYFDLFLLVLKYRDQNKCVQMNSDGISFITVDGKSIIICEGKKTNIEKIRKLQAMRCDYIFVSN